MLLLLAHTAPRVCPHGLLQLSFTYCFRASLLTDLWRDLTVAADPLVFLCAQSTFRNMVQVSVLAFRWPLTQYLYGHYHTRMPSVILVEFLLRCGLVALTACFLTAFLALRAWRLALLLQARYYSHSWLTCDPPRSERGNLD